jgi:hypothetical protein
MVSLLFLVPSADGQDCTFSGAVTFMNDIEDPAFTAMGWRIAGSYDPVRAQGLFTQVSLQNLDTGAFTFLGYQGWGGGDNGNVDALQHLICWSPGQYRWRATLGCSNRYEYGLGTPINFTGEFTIAYENPKLQVKLLEPPTAIANVEVTWAFDAHAYTPVVRVNGTQIATPTPHSGTRQLLLAPGTHRFRADYCQSSSTNYHATSAEVVVPSAETKPTFTFDLPDPAQEKVLTHKYGPDEYPSAMQTEDRKIRVGGTLRDQSGKPVAGKPVHFRLSDPADTASYVVAAGDAAPGDNIDGPGSLNGGGTAATVTTDANGRVSLTLTITDHVAGDNYRIRASPDPTFACTEGCAWSATYTAWKRVYVEVNKMFRRGAFLTEDVAPGAKQLLDSPSARRSC